MEMSLQLKGFEGGVEERDLLARLAWLRDVIGPRLERFLGYYRNPTTELAAGLSCGMGTSFAVRPFRQYQELGLPARITGFRRAADGAGSATGTVDTQRKEVVIENDIGWRVNTMVDFVAGRMPNVTSTAKDAVTRTKMTEVVGAILTAGGGVMLLQELVLQGAIAGSAWVRICPTAELLTRLAGEVGDGGGTDGEAEGRDIESVKTSADVGALALDVARWLRLMVSEYH